MGDAIIAELVAALDAILVERLATYSKGMARRIGLAQALIAKPSLLVLDEPTSGLDPVGNREVRDLRREQAELSKAIRFDGDLGF